MGEGAHVGFHVRLRSSGGSAGGQGGREEAERGHCLVGNHAIAQRLELCGAGQAGDGGDVPGGQAHEPFDKDGAQPSHSVNWPGGRPPEVRFPAGDRRTVLAPVEVAEVGRLAISAARHLP